MTVSDSATLLAALTAIEFSSDSAMKKRGDQWDGAIIRL